MPGSHCSFPNCGLSKEKNPRLSLFKFPSDKERSLIWIKATGRQDFLGRSTDYLHNNNKICQMHFEDKYFMNKETKNRLTHNAIPTILKTIDASASICDESPSVTSNADASASICDETESPSVTSNADASASICDESPSVTSNADNIKMAKLESLDTAISNSPESIMMPNVTDTFSINRYHNYVRLKEDKETEQNNHFKEDSIDVSAYEIVHTLSKEVATNSSRSCKTYVNRKVQVKGLKTRKEILYLNQIKRQSKQIKRLKEKISKLKDELKHQAL